MRHLTKSSLLPDGLVGTTLSVFNLHNPRATIRHTLYHMIYRIITKMTKRGANRGGYSMHKSHSNRYNALALAIVYISNPRQINDFTNANLINTKTYLWARVNGTEIVLKSTDRHSAIYLSRYVQGLFHRCLTVLISKVIGWICFNTVRCISWLRTLWMEYLQC